MLGFCGYSRRMPTSQVHGSSARCMLLRARTTQLWACGVLRGLLAHAPPGAPDRLTTFAPVDLAASETALSTSTAVQCCVATAGLVSPTPRGLRVPVRAVAAADDFFVLLTWHGTVMDSRSWMPGEC